MAAKGIIESAICSLPVCQVDDHIVELRSVSDCFHCLIAVINEVHARLALLHKWALRYCPALRMFSQGSFAIVISLAWCMWQVSQHHERLAWHRRHHPDCRHKERSQGISTASSPRTRV